MKEVFSEIAVTLVAFSLLFEVRYEKHVMTKKKKKKKKERKEKRKRKKKEWWSSLKMKKIIMLVLGSADRVFQC